MKNNLIKKLKEVKNSINWKLCSGLAAIPFIADSIYHLIEGGPVLHDTESTCRLIGETILIGGIGGHISYKKNIEAKIMEEKKNKELKERAKELDCLYNISQIIETPNISTEEICEDTVNMIPHSWQYPEVTCSEIILKGKSYKSPNFKRTKWKQSSKIKNNADEIGSLNVYYSQEKPTLDEGPFQKEERNLIDCLSKRLGKVISGKKTGKELNQSEQRYKTLFDSSPDGILISDKEGDKFLYGNQSICDFLGYSLEELKKIGIKEIHQKQDLKYIIKEFNFEKNKGNSQKFPNLKNKKYLGFNIPCIKKDREVVYADVNSAKINIDGKDAIVGFFRDVTKQKDAENSLTETEKKLKTHIDGERKMETIGTLIRGISHDFNNSLAGVMGYSELALFSDDLNIVKKNIKQSLNSSKKARDLVQKLQAYSKESYSSSKKENLNLYDNFNEIFDFLKKTTNKNIKYENNLPKTELSTFFDASDFNEIFMNLATNSTQSIKKKEEKMNLLGTNYSPYIKIYNKSNDESVQLCFEDNGTGISKENLDKIFDPGFTTKPLGTQQGQGMGLAMVHKIIRDNGGNIEVKSMADKTQFYISLPKKNGNMARKKQEGINMEMGKNETILMVDDEKHIIESTKEILEKYGYNVLIAEDGKQGFEMYKKYNPELVLLDRSMPKLSGDVVLEKILNKDNSAKVIISSGHSNDFLKKTNSYNNVPYLQKPYGISELLETIRKTLDSK